MNKYQNGKIYTIRHSDTDKYYIGSTCEKLCRRFSKHKSEYKTERIKSTSKLLFDLGIDKCYIELLENYPCNSKEELNKKEGEYQRLFKNEIVNITIMGRTSKQYKEDNKEKVKQDAIIWKLNNKEKLKECKDEWILNNQDKIVKYNNKKKEKIICECGSEIQKAEKSRHEKSKKHLAQF